MADALASRPVPQSLLFALIVVLALAVAPHFWNLDLWITGTFYSIALLRVLIWPRADKLPSRWLLIPLMLISTFVVLIQSGYSEGRQFGVALLVVMLGMKLLELKTRRDLYITLFLGYFLLITQFLFSKDMGLTAYAFVLVLGLTAILHAANQVQSKLQPIAIFRRSALYLISALPVMLALFLLFPRLDGPLWSFKVGSGKNITGITDRISLGSLSELSQSRATAFRAEFDGPLPIPGERYWRGIVLWRTDGYEWNRAKTPAGSRSLPHSDASDLNYEITMEPSQQRWLFPLDRITGISRHHNFDSDHLLTTNEPIKSRYSYQASSNTQFIDKQLDDREWQLGLQLPDNVSDRMRELVHRWQQKSSDPAEMVKAALDHYRNEPFVYTLKPPALGSNPIDSFLFETRKGFCEHYATSFVMLMRIAGIPARVVIGYQGGELNPQGGHLIVRQSDAHAWAEVWLEDAGWVRVDPTAAIAPNRIEQTIEVAQQKEGAPVVFQLPQRGLFGSVLRQLGWMTDNLDYQWHRWIVGYNRTRQSELLKNFGLEFLKGYGLSAATVIVPMLAGGLVLLLVIVRHRNKQDPLIRDYLRFQHKLKKAGLEFAPWFSPGQLANLAARKFPAQADEIKQIVNLYQAARYGRPMKGPADSGLHESVARLRLNANADL